MLRNNLGKPRKVLQDSVVSWIFNNLYLLTCFNDAEGISQFDAGRTVTRDLIGCLIEGRTFLPPRFPLLTVTKFKSCNLSQTYLESGLVGDIYTVYLGNV